MPGRFLLNSAFYAKSPANAVSGTLLPLFKDCDHEVTPTARPTLEQLQARLAHRPSATLPVLPARAIRAERDHR